MGIHLRFRQLFPLSLTPTAITLLAINFPQHFVAVAQAGILAQLVKKHGTIIADVLGVIDEWELDPHSMAVGFLTVRQIIDETVVQLGRGYGVRA